jgi:chromosome segregation ATPase
MTASADPTRRRLPLGVNSLPGAGFLHDRLNDAVHLLSALPEIVVALHAIEQHIEHLDGEVTRMREGVNRLEDEVKGLRSEIDELSSGINEVSASVGRLEPHISDISRIARPLKRRRRTDVERVSEPRPLPSGEDEPPLSEFA